MFFADAWLLWVLVPLLALWAVAWGALQAAEGRRLVRSSSAVRFSTLAALRRLRPSTTLLLRRVVQTSRIAVLGLLVVAMARPQTGRTQTQVHSVGIDIMLVLDTSGSMQALDLDTEQPSVAARRNRLQVVKEVVERFVTAREHDQIGMVVFGEQAFTQCPLTLDHGILATFLDRVEIGVAGADATAIGDGLGMAVKRLRKSTAASKVVILLTDGRNNAGVLSPNKAAEIAKTLGVKVYTIGAGTRGKAPFIRDTIFGKQIVQEDVAIDEEMLQRVAETTGGSYYRAEDARALEQIYEHIDELERSRIEMKSYQEYDERFAWFLAPGLGLLLLEVVLLGTRLRKIP